MYPYDIMTSGSTVAEHDDRLSAVMKRLQDARLRVNKDKCDNTWSTK